MRKFFLASITALMLPAAAMAQSSLPPLEPVNPANPASNLAIMTIDPTDAKFLTSAAAAGLAEVQDGKLAESQGSPAVRKIGAAMVTDHTNLNIQMKELALREGVTIPSAVTGREAEITAKLQGLSGSAFDAEYLHTQKRAHEKVIALFKTEATTGSDANLRQFAHQTLPTLQMHLRMVEAALH
jgi:putative membrane protein